ncbi:MAG: hypothetical protein WEA56_02720 [Balneolaceae bacterium]
MNHYPLVEMLAFFSRHGRLEKPHWRKDRVKHLKRVRSCHCKTEGGIKKCFYTLETRDGSLVNLVFNEEELTWSLEPGIHPPGLAVDRVLALVKRHKHGPSRAHRIIPYRFEIGPAPAPEISGGTDPALTDRVQPFRFHTGKLASAQVTAIETRHLENIMITKHLHYVVETDSGRFFHLVYILDECDWRLMQEVDEEFFFVR